MTTVAYKDGVMASDSRATEDDEYIVGSVQKVWKLPNGALYGSAGDSDDRVLRDILGKIPTTFFPQTLREAHFPSVNELSEDTSDVSAIFVFPDGDVWMIGTKKNAEVVNVKSSFCAIGSGKKFALGAMFNGVDAKAAVKTAMAFDICSGGDVQSVSIEEPRAKKSA